MPKKIHRFITPARKNGNNLEITESNIIHQIREVLKLRSGETIAVIMSNVEYTGTIIDILKDKITVEITTENINTVSPEKNVTLYLSILKKENFELVLQKAGEMGVNAVVPVITERTVKTNLNFERLGKISREASELSGRSNVTIVDEINNFEQAVLNDKGQEKILFDITGQDFGIRQDLTQETVSIYVGPEGGFTEKEIAFAIEHGIKIYNLGKLTLRGETAGIIASYLALQ